VRFRYFSFLNLQKKKNNFVAIFGSADALAETAAAKIKINKMK